MVPKRGCLSRKVKSILPVEAFVDKNGVFAEYFSSRTPLFVSLHKSFIKIKVIMRKTLFILMTMMGTLTMQAAEDVVFAVCVEAAAE